MSVNAKHLATFVLGAAAGVALNKYLQSEDGEKLMDDLKAKGTELKNEAEGAIEQAPEYFEQLKAKMTELLQNNFPEAEKMLQDLLTSHKPAAPTVPEK